MSTEHQKYSTTNQLRTINEYASQNDVTVVQVYADEGVSGLHIKNRLGLQQLLNDVVRGKASFGIVLVYDISRWGRFQDPDQSAHYEYLCRMSGVDVVYCAEIFQGNDSPMAAVYKSMRRIEAADFSRDLSIRIFRAQSYRASLGFAQGGEPKYGLRRLLVDDKGKPVKKHIPRWIRPVGLHSVYAPGPPKEVRAVQLIFERYVKFGEKPSKIARYLNSKGYKKRNGQPWIPDRVRDILSDEKYIGTMVWGRTSQKMNGRTKVTPQSEWVRKTNAFPAIVDAAIFEAAQKRRKKEHWRYTEEELLQLLRAFLAKHGFITQPAMLKYKGVPAPGLYQRHFGSMVNAYKLIGYEWHSTNGHWKETIRRRRIRTGLVEELSQIVSDMGRNFRVNAWHNRIWVENISCQCRLNCELGRRRKELIWHACFKTWPTADFYLFGRLDLDAETIKDYYLVPHATMPTMPWGLKIKNEPQVDAYRAKDLRAVAQRLVEASTKSRPIRGIMTSHMAP